VAVSPHLDGRRGRGVGENQVQRVGRELRDETLRPLVHAVEMDRLGEVERRLEYLVGDPAWARPWPRTPPGGPDG
jgi:hypothetical protein